MSPEHLESADLALFISAEFPTNEAAFASWLDDANEMMELQWTRVDVRLAGHDQYTHWTAEEDRMLRKAVALEGRNWKRVARIVGTRSRSAARSRAARLCL